MSRPLKRRSEEGGKLPSVNADVGHLRGFLILCLITPSASIEAIRWGTYPSSRGKRRKPLLRFK